tara:strand:+ start:248 stop:1252 length:1005 start_codon:yes stop_codon:yes gene_type:complete
MIEENAEQLVEEETDLGKEDFELPVIQTSQEEKFFGKTTQVSNASDDELEVQVVETEEVETPKENIEEIDSVSGRVQKRIDKLKYEFHEERRAKEDAQRMRDEAVNAAQTLNSQLQQARQMVSRGQQAVVSNVAAKAEAELEHAKRVWSDATDEGDKEAIINAQEKMLEAKLQLTQADAAMKKQPPPRKPPKQPVQQAPSPQQIAQAQPPQLDPMAEEWLGKNEWFNTDKKLTGFAMGVHEDLLTEGINPQTREYYDKVDAEMKRAFPNNFSDSELDEGQTAPTRNAATMVAPATRNNGGKPRKVQLTPTQVSLARKLGLSAEQYAKQIVKEMN